MKCLKTHYLSNVILKQLNNLEHIISEPIMPTLASKKRNYSAFTFMYTKLSPFIIIIICINKDIYIYSIYI